MTILIIASIYDQNAERLASEWKRKINVELITVKTIISDNLTVYFGEDDKNVIINGNKYAIKNITSVINLLPYVTIQELPHIDSKNKNYVAQEIQAFLLGFLLKLDRNVFNKPTPVFLLGLSWKNYKWYIELTKYNLLVDIGIVDNREGYYDFFLKRDAAQKIISVINGNVSGTIDKNFIQKIKKFVKDYNISLLSIKYFINRNNEIVITNVIQFVDIGNSRIRDLLLLECLKINK